MVAIAGACLVLLCILLFLMGIEIGKLLNTNAVTPAIPAATVVPGTAPAENPAATPKAQTSTP